MKSKLVRRTGFSLAGILTVLSALWWLWGNSTPYYLEAVGDLVRRHAADRSPELRALFAEKDLQAAAKDASDVGVLVAQVERQIRSIDQDIERLVAAQKADEATLARLAEQLRSVKPEERVVINHKTFTREDIENDATVVLDRCRARKTQIEELRTYRTEEVAARDDVRGDLRDAVIASVEP